MTPSANLAVRYPPGLLTVQVPVHSRRAALAGLSMFMACRPFPLFAHHALYGVVAVVGSRALPGRREEVEVGLEPEMWRTLATAWGAALGWFDGVAVIARRQTLRPGLLVLLLRSGRPVAFVKTRTDGAPLERERQALAAVEPCAPFTVCPPIAWGVNGGHHWLACAPLPSGPHRPAWRVAMRDVTDAIGCAVQAIPRPDGLPAHWRPMHGDFAPWNLRRSQGRTWLLDWEDAGWGPPNADRVYWQASIAALRRRLTARWQPDEHEAVEWWAANVRARLAKDPNSWLDQGLLIALENGRP